MKSSYWLKKSEFLPVRGLYGGCVLLESFTRSSLRKERTHSGIALELEKNWACVDELFGNMKTGTLISEKRQYR